MAVAMTSCSKIGTGPIDAETQQTIAGLTGVLLELAHR